MNNKLGKARLPASSDALPGKLALLAAIEVPSLTRQATPIRGQQYEEEF